MLKIYGVPISVHTRKAIVVAIAKGLKHEVVPVVPVIPGNPPRDWDKLSPTGKIPVLADGACVIADSSAICAYLERLQPTPSVYPQGAQAYAAALALEQYAGHLFREVVHPLFHEVFVQPRIRSVPTDRQRIDEVLEKALPRAFGYLDGIADEPSASPATIGGIAVVSNLITLHYAGFALERRRFPRLAGLFDRALRQPALAEALRREQPAVDSMGLRNDLLEACSG